MAFDLNRLNKKSRHDPERVLIYGPPGTGKTTLATEWPNPVVFDIERGLPPGIDVANFQEFDSYETVMEGIYALYSQDHDFRTLVVDTLDRFEPMVWRAVCEAGGVASIEEFGGGYGKGHLEADRFWRDFLEGCNALRCDRNMAIVLVAHSIVTTLPSPTTESFPSYDIRLHKRALALVQDEVDAILFMNQDVSVKETKGGFNKKTARGIGGGNRWIYADGRPAFTAKNRYRLPDQFSYQPGSGYAFMAPYLADGIKAAEAEAAAAAEQQAEAA